MPKAVFQQVNSLITKPLLLRANGWQLYVWRDGSSATLIDTGAPGSGTEIAAVGASVMAGAGDAGYIHDGATMPPAVFENWEIPIYERVSAGLPDAAPAVAVDRELTDGDVLDFGGGAHIFAIPGHTEGSITMHLPEHGVLFAGDTIANVGSVMLGVFNQDRARTVASFKRLAALDVQTACFGHGGSIESGAGDRIREVADRLTP